LSLPQIDAIVAHYREIYTLALFLFGLAAGSFLNVVACRLPFGISIIAPPSSCPRCGSRISLFDNIPVLGWLRLRGRCRRCRQPIAWRYPAVELAIGILWGWIGWQASASGLEHWETVWLTLCRLVFVLVVGAVFLIDLDHRIIPDELSLGGLFAALAASAFVPSLHHAETSAAFQAAHPVLHGMTPSAPLWAHSLMAAAAGALVGGLGMLALTLGGTVLMRGAVRRAQEQDPELDTVMGFGDVKLMALLGAFLGWKDAVAAFLIANLAGVLVGVPVKIATGEEPAGNGSWMQRLSHRWRTGVAAVPFGPFLVVGALVMVYEGAAIRSWFLNLVFPSM